MKHVVVAAMAAVAVVSLAVAWPAAAEDKAPPPAPPSTAVERSLPHPAGGRCDVCHTPSGWKPARFSHDRTGFPLRGRHTAVDCAGCHKGEWQDPVPQTCSACHADPHLQEFGQSCSSCHTEETWQPLFLVDAHRRTQFPLSGRHASLPCEECHVEKRDRTFTRAALACTQCHTADAARASATTLNHRALEPTCQSCHTPVAFAPARLPAHEVCFPLAGTVHAPIRCGECHVQQALIGARVTGSCRSLVRCAECHTHAKKITDAQHKGVPGYAHQSNKCADCHRSGK
jgi:hypothetical protein